MWKANVKASSVQEERQEKEFRKAEMEATKASNMIEHESEIFSRPKKEWFLSAREKKALAESEKGAPGPADPATEKGKSRPGKAERNALTKGTSYSMLPI